MLHMHLPGADIALNIDTCKTTMSDSNKSEKIIPSFAEIRATLAEVAAQNRETAALAQESWRQMLELKAQMAKTDTQMAKTDKKIDKLLRSSRELHSHVRNDADTCEQRFIDGLKLHNLAIAGVTFDEIYPNNQKERKGHNIELDALLVNGDSVAILEVKKKLHLNDVLKVRDSLIGRFRNLYPEHQAKRLMVLVAGESVNNDAATAALEAGFVVLSFKAQQLEMQNLQPRYY